MKTVSAIFFVLLLQLYVNAQNINKYTFSKTTANTYTDLSGDVAVTTSFNPNTGLYTIPGLTGEKFRFFGDTFLIGGNTQVSVGEYPFLRIEDNTSLVIVDGAFTYADTIDGTSRVSYLVQGPPGSRVIKTQYKNMKLSNGPVGNFINLQICYYQQNHVIEIHYGPRSANNASGYSASQGPNIGIFYSPLNFSGCLGKLWCTGTPAVLVLDSAKNYVFNALSGVPDNGTIYRFTPRAAALPSVSTVSAAELALENELAIVPNPVADALFLQGDWTGTTIYAYNSTGQFIKEWSVVNSNQLLDVSDFLPGCYYLMVSDRQGDARWKKFVVLR